MKPGTKGFEQKHAEAAEKSVQNPGRTTDEDNDVRTFPNKGRRKITFLRNFE